MTPRNFIFDLDGTLVDSLPGIARALVAALPPRVRPIGDMRRHIGPPVRAILSSLAGPCSESDLDLMEARFRAAYDAGAWRETALFPGIHDVVRQLAESGKRLFVVTNKPLKPAMSILRMVNLLGWFEDVITPDSASPPFRNKAEMLRALVEQWRLEVAESLFIGDTADDYRAAEAAAMNSVFLAHGYGREHLAKEAPGRPLLAHPALISKTFLSNGAAL
jgi:phosphoglycolate phosphatase